ncbi:TPA: hypothetical protein SMI10_003175 [Serratia liquefaciens]|nr:hypothetical protein [Serratia liquefaciens]
MTQTLTTTEELRHLASSDNANELTRRFARELLANREAQPVAVTDEMALAFHRALNDGGIGESDLEEIKVGLRGALCNITAPPAPAVVKLPTTRLWAGVVECYSKDDVISAMNTAGVEISND